MKTIINRLHHSLLMPYWRIKIFLKEIINQFIEDNLPMRAGSLAYTSLLSLVPLMTVSLTVMSAFPIFKPLGLQLQAYLFQNFVAASAKSVQTYLLNFSSQALNLSATGMLFLVITSVLMIFNMEQAFNAIWRVKRSRKGIAAFMLYWGLITFLPILIGMGFAITSYVFSLPFIQITTTTLGLHRVILSYFPYLLTFIAFTVLYITLPNCKIYIRHAALGGIIATLLFESAKFGFGIYVLNFPTYELIYGALAAIPIFLLWIYLSWLIILFGAVVAHIASGGTSLAISHLNESF